MSNRKDNKGRVLHRGEGQRPDGRYSFKDTNWMGKTCFVYSWTLTIHHRAAAQQQ
ncbi:MAG: integrase DNA-binding domain-containing protein [Collinsella sp.]